MNYNELQFFKLNCLIFAYRIPRRNNWRLDMVRICIECKKNYGMKEPLCDKSTTHGLCDACYNLIMKIREEKVQLKLREANEET
jgi:predicted  nucleic acid-binding Zn ribbon protein